MKKDWQSSTVWGAVIMAGALVVKMVWGVDINEQTQAAATNDVVTVISAVMGLIGGVTTVIGRAKATGPINLSMFRILKYLPGVLRAIGRAKSKAGLLVLLVAVSAVMPGCVFEHMTANLVQPQPNGDKLIVGRSSWALNWSVKPVAEILPNLGQAAGLAAGQNASGAQSLLTVLNALSAAQQAAKPAQPATPAAPPATGAEK